MLLLEKPFSRSRGNPRRMNCRWFLPLAYILHLLKLNELWENQPQRGGKSQKLSKRV
jgi:hypothetical protein